MRASADPSGQSPLRRLALLGLLFVAAILSCGKDVTGPLSAAGRFVRGLSWEPIFPAAFHAAGGAGSGVVQFNRVHVVLHHSDGTVALDTTIDFPPDDDSLTVNLTVKLLDNAPPSGEPMTLNLGYLNAAGDTVFKGGPVSITAAPPPAGGGSNPPIKVPVSYTGPGSSAVSVAISPRSGTVVADAGFSFTAIAKDKNGVTLAGTPIIWNSLDPAIATINSAAAGTGLAQNQRGTARIIAQLLTGPADTVQLFVLLPASNIVAQSGNGQFGVVGTNLALPLVVKVAATDGVGVAGTTVHFAVATGGGSVGSASAISDASGLAQTTFKLGTGTGAQTVTATAAGLNNSPVTFIDTAQAATASKLVVTTQPVNSVAGTALTPIVVTAEDNNGNIATTFTGPVTVSFGANSAAATLGGTATVNAIAGVATFSTITINKNGSAYTLVASSTGLTSATTSAFDIAVGAPSKLAFTVQPLNAVANVAIAPAIVVTAKDAGNNTASGFVGNVTLTFGANPGGATLSGTATVAAVAGIASFNNISLNKAAIGYTLNAASGALTPDISTAFNITAGPATTIAVSAGQAQSGLVSTVLATPLAVLVTDANANPVAGRTINWAVTAGGGSVALASSVTNAAGIATDNWTLGAATGNGTVTATSAGLAGSPLTFTATATVSTANKTWTGATNNLWATATNWSPAGVPATTDSVFIPVTANNPTLAANATVTDLYISSGATLTLGSGVTLIDNGTLDATGGILGTGIVVLNGVVPRSIKGSVTAGSVNLFGTYTQNGSFIVVGNLVNNSGGSLIMNGNTTAVTGNFSTAGSGTLTMNNAADALTVTGNVTFGGGNETGLLTNGNLVVGGNLTATGLGLDASGSHTTTLNSGSSAQAINWTSAVAGHGLQNLIFRNAGAKSFSGSQGINGNVTLATSVTSGVTGAYNISIAGSGITDSSSVGGGAWQVGTTIFTGTPTVIPSLMSTSTLEFAGGTMVSLPNNVSSGGSIIVDGTGTNLKLNGNVLTTAGAAMFTTQNGGTLQMTAAGDTLNAYGGSFFNGGSTVGLLIAGAIRTSQLLQGYNTAIGPPFVSAPGASATAFSASPGHTVFIANGGTAYVEFANPGTGGAGSHFGSLQYAPSGQLVVMSNVFVDDSLYVTFASPTSIVSDSLSTAGSTRLITTQGVSIATSPSYPLMFGNVAVKLMNGEPFSSGSFDNVIWQSFPTSFTGTVFEASLSTGAPTFTNHNFTSVVSSGLGAGGEYLRNSGSVGITMTGAIGIVVSLLAAGLTFP